jgi:hypothetical protein
LRIHYRPALMVTVCACAAVCFAGESRAFSLQRIAASLDMSHIAAPSNTVPVATASLHHAIAPATAELTAPSTEIEIKIPSECDVEIQVVDESGVRVCGAHVHMPAGVQKLGFCGRDANGRELPNGVYYYSVIVGDDVSTTRITISR